MKARKKKRHIFLRLALLAFSVYVVVVLVQLQLETDQAQKRLDALDEEKEKAELVIEDLEWQLEHLEERHWQQAHENGYSLEGELIITEVPGAD